MLGWVILLLFIYLIFVEFVANTVKDFSFGVKLAHFIISDIFGAALLLFWFVYQYPEVFNTLFKR